MHKHRLLRSKRLVVATGWLGQFTHLRLIARFLLVIPGLAIPTFSQVFVDDVLIQDKSEWLRPLIVGIILTAFLNGFLTLLQLRFLRRMKIKLVVGMTSRFI